MSTAVQSACGLRGFVTARHTSHHTGPRVRHVPGLPLVTTVANASMWWHIGDRRADTGYVRLRESDDAST